MPNLTSEITRVSASGQEPLSIDDAKLWLRVDFPDDDPLIAGLCSAARQYAEKFCRRSFLLGEQWKLSLDHFPLAFLSELVYQNLPLSEAFPTLDMYSLFRPNDLAIELTMGPVNSVDAITYVDTTGTTQTLAASAYTVVPDFDGNTRIYPAYETGWPSTQNYPQSVNVLYTTGEAVEDAVLLALKQMVAHWYANREAFVMVSGVVPQQVPMAAEMMLWPYRYLEF